MQQTENTFGTWLRRQRRQMDLTQVELAARLDYSVVTIRKLERDELRPSRQLAERLAEFFDVSTAYRPKLVAFARMQPSHSEPEVSSPGASPVPTNLPIQLTPFFGRTAELLELANYLSDPACRLLTIVGSGGIGKTRLALEVTHTLPVQPPHGIYFVALAQLRATEHIVPAIAEALDLRFQADGRSPQQQLLDYLRHKQMLLVLDNFEHLKDGVELLLEILQNCPGVRLLVTARERLQLTIETVYVVDGMDFPATNAGHAAGTYSAIQLFVASARRGRRKFTLDANNEQDVIRICHLVGGVPLAIILAAAWIKVLSPAEIAAELSRDLDFLAAELYDLPARHQSMRAVLAQSWQRLTTDEQVVFMRLAVFRGGFTRAAAQSVAGASLRTLSALTSKSMVRRDANGRYAIHELLRQFGEAELEAAGQRLAAGAAHCAYYMNYLHQREPDIKGRRQVPALNEIEADFENVRAAWQWATLQRDYAAVERACWKRPDRFCEMRSRFYDGLELLRAGREHLAPSAGVAPHPVWGSLMSHVLGQDFRWFEPPAESRTRHRASACLGAGKREPHRNCLLPVAPCYGSTPV